MITIIDGHVTALARVRKAIAVLYKGNNDPGRNAGFTRVITMTPNIDNSGTGSKSHRTGVDAIKR